MWTDRFIKVPVMEYDIKQKDLTGEEVLQDSYEKINPMEISNYRPSYSNDDPEHEAVAVVLKNGDKTLVYLTVKEFEKLLNDHQK